jgi:hypothetical protein
MAHASMATPLKLRAMPQYRVAASALRLEAVAGWRDTISNSSNGDWL